MQVILQEKSGVIWMDVFIYTSSFNFILLTGCQDIKIKTGKFYMTWSLVFLFSCKSALALWQVFIFCKIVKQVLSKLAYVLIKKQEAM